MRIAVDAMGSDAAPAPEIHGAIMASKDADLDIVLVGDRAVLESELAKAGSPKNIAIAHASQRISMNEAPMAAVRQKKDSSIHVGLRLVRDGEADAFVSCGSTGAVMMGARVLLMPVQGVRRSALCQVLPTLDKPCVVLDLGANVDCNARHLCDFAEMGMMYSRYVWGAESPRVGLLNIGEEQAKGNEVAKKVHYELSAAPHINFIGNIEPKALYRGDADVVVCDGFVGNVLLKTSEAVAMFITTLMSREVRSTWISRLGAIFMLGTRKRIKRTIDPNEYPGALLLGVRGTVIILHGASSAQGVATAIDGAAKAVKADIVSRIREGIAELREAEAKIAAEAPMNDDPMNDDPMNEEAVG